MTGLRHAFAASLRLIPYAILVAALASGLLIAKQWAYFSTYRLYLDRRVDDAARSTATQRFDLDRAHVVPQIDMRDDRASFRTAIGEDSTIRVELRPEGTARFEIRLHQDGTDRLACRGEVARATAVACPFPTGNGVIEIVSQGQLVWSDLRVDRNLRVASLLVVLGLLLACWLTWTRSRAARALVTATASPAYASRVRHAWLTGLRLLVTAGVSVLVLEVGLRAVGDRLSAGISAARRDLGERTEDPRWEESPRYGRRLRASVDAANEWHQGDIIRMGFIPPAVSEGRVHRYAFHTDAEGFRNAASRDRIVVAALGDSFTDALTMPVEMAWPSQLEQRIGAPVQNYGTAGFGPQQELLVLQDYALRHHPRVVVLAFFAGNDIRDAEAFEQFQKADGTTARPSLGWPIKDVISRFDTWYLVSAVQAAAAGLATPRPVAASATAGSSPPTPPASAAAHESPTFDRGVFSVPVQGRTLRWAFMPPYLNMLNFSEDDLAARRGWALTRQTLAEMQRASRDAGAEFVVMFLPFKSQVYLPELERAFSPDELAAAFQFSLHAPVTAPDVARMSHNRLALNRLMQRFCDERSIPFLDVTGGLQRRVEGGENMYFQDDSHLNEAGEAVVAALLAAFLQDRALIDHSGGR